MVIVSGWLRVDADERAAYLDGCAQIIDARVFQHEVGSSDRL